MTRALQRQQEKQAVAKRVMRRMMHVRRWQAWRAWRCKIARSKRSREQKCRAVRLLSRCLLAKAHRVWVDYVAWKHEKRAIIERCAFNAQRGVMVLFSTLDGRPSLVCHARCERQQHRIIEPWSQRGGCPPHGMSAPCPANLILLWTLRRALQGTVTRNVLRAGVQVETASLRSSLPAVVGAGGVAAGHARQAAEGRGAYAQRADGGHICRLGTVHTPCQAEHQIQSDGGCTGP
jgi:hypothetical protein